MAISNLARFEQEPFIETRGLVVSEYAELMFRLVGVGLTVGPLIVWPSLKMLGVM
jgi:hypothetical protein